MNSFFTGWQTKDPTRREVEQAQKHMVNGYKGVKPKFFSKSKMRDHIVDVLKAHPNLTHYVGEPGSMPERLKQKLQYWDQSTQMRVEGNVILEFENTKYAIPVQIIVHPDYPRTGPVVFVSRDLYNPRWSPGTSTLNEVCTKIINDYATLPMMFRGANVGNNNEGEQWLNIENFMHILRAPPLSSSSEPVKPEVVLPAAKARPDGYQIVDENTPESFVCPISMELMVDPVAASDGHTYDRDDIERWLIKHNTSPLTNEELASKELVPDAALKQQIAEYVQMRQ
mmetsp:Transcript_45874/g.93880  ORF Transcript_45874/g.93880 Transcript_45874/m.93880 type:complete len:283 (+) Transcript_45874:91-939(+)